MTDDDQLTMICPDCVRVWDDCECGEFTFGHIPMAKRGQVAKHEAKTVTASDRTGHEH